MDRAGLGLRREYAAESVIANKDVGALAQNGNL
jgi:hypothetical protein